MGEETSRELFERDVVVYGFKLHYRESGTGPPVILLHGLGGDGSRWSRNIAPLAKDFRVLALDQIGFGQSDKPMANYHTGMLAEFLMGFMQSVGITKASLVGNSMGAAVAAYCAVHFAYAVEKMVLANGFLTPSHVTKPTMDPHIRRIQNGATLAETREFLRLMVYDKSLITEEMVEASYTSRLRCAFTIEKMQQSLAAGVGQITVDEARSIAAPTMIVWGQHDALISVSIADELQAVIPGARKVILNKAGHLPHLEMPDVFNKVVRDFLLERK